MFEITSLIMKSLPGSPHDSTNEIEVSNSIFVIRPVTGFSCKCYIDSSINASPFICT